MSMAAVASVVGAGAAVYGASQSGKKVSGGTQTQDTSPWEYAQPWMINNLNEGQALQNYYKQNPFNPQQQQAYSNLFGDIDNFRSQIAPGLFGKANEMMGSNYQRKSYDRPGLVGYSQGGGGLLNQPAAQQTFRMPQGGNYGLLNFAPPQPVQAPQAAAIDDKTMAKMIQDELARIQKVKDEDAMFALISGGTG